MFFLLHGIYKTKDSNRRIWALRKQSGGLFLAKMCEAGTEIRKDFGRRALKELCKQFFVESLCLCINELTWKSEFFFCPKTADFPPVSAWKWLQPPCFVGGWFFVYFCEIFSETSVRPCIFQILTTAEHLKTRREEERLLRDFGNCVFPLFK